MTCPASTPREPEVEIVLFGHSHTRAVQLAVERRLRKGLTAPVQPLRAKAEKNGLIVGDVSFSEFLQRVSKLRSSDVVLSMIGGNQHAVFGTIQHPQPFDFFPVDDCTSSRENIELIPRRAIEEVLGTAFRNGDGGMLKALRRATAARVVHVLPPPPKGDNNFIAVHHGQYFARLGIDGLGISPPQLRLKLWQLQADLVGNFCRDRGVKVFMPPGKATENGFLRPDYYAKDTTHANWLYGELVLRSLEKRFPNHRRLTEKDFAV